MDNFDYQAYIKSGKIHGEKSTLTEAQATGFGIGQGRSKTISKGKESNPDLKDTLKGKEKKKTKYFMKNGIPHKADGTPLKKMSNENMVADEDIEKEIKRLEDENPKGFAKEISKLKVRQAAGDLMKKAKAKGEVSEIEESALAVAAGVASVFGGAAALNKIMDKLEKGDLGEKGKKLASTLASMGKAAGDVAQVRNESVVTESKGAMNYFSDLKFNYQKAFRYLDVEEREEYKRLAKDFFSKLQVDDKVRAVGLEEMSKPEKGEKEFEELKEEEQSSKIRVSELKAKIKETILAELTLSEADEDVDVDIEDEIEADIEEPTPDSSAIGLSQDEQEIQDNLKLAYDNAVAIGDQKLADQIGNSITFFTRTHVVER